MALFQINIHERLLQKSLIPLIQLDEADVGTSGQNPEWLKSLNSRVRLHMGSGVHPNNPEKLLQEADRFYRFVKNIFSLFVKTLW